MLVTPPALRATSPSKGRGGVFVSDLFLFTNLANFTKLLNKSINVQIVNCKIVNDGYPSGTACHLPFLRQGRSG